MIKLYYAAHTCSLASHIALNDSGARYLLDLIDVEIREGTEPHAQ